AATTWRDSHRAPAPNAEPPDEALAPPADPDRPPPARRGGNQRRRGVDRGRARRSGADEYVDVVIEVDDRLDDARAGRLGGPAPSHAPLRLRMAAGANAHQPDSRAQGESVRGRFSHARPSLPAVGAGAVQSYRRSGFPCCRTAPARLVGERARISDWRP